MAVIRYVWHIWTRLPVLTYKPGKDIARISDLPFELFDDRFEALKWVETETS
jgi:hypothetical protein